MMEREINEFVRIIGSISLNPASKERITDFLISNSPERKESSVKYLAAASAVAFLAVGTVLLTRGFNITMRGMK